MPLPSTLATLRQWSLRLSAAGLLLLSGCGEYHGPLDVQVQNHYPTAIQVYQTGLNAEGKRETALIGRVEANGAATFPKALKPGEKVYHLKFKDPQEKPLGDVVTTSASLQKKLGAGHTWSVTAGPDPR